MANTAPAIESKPCPRCGTDMEVWMGDGDWTTDTYECPACGYEVEAGELESA